MCGRTALTATPEELREALGLDETPALVPHYNVPPSQPLAVLRAPATSVVRTLERSERADGKPGHYRCIELLRWGLVPAWAKDAKIGHRLALARVESIANRSAFRDPLRKRRCLVIVDGFFEWRREGKRQSTPFFVRLPDSGPFALAGVWERWVARDGEIIESCAIITQPSRPPVDAIHDRMPLVLERDAWDRWLDPALIGDDALAPLLEPRAPALVAYPVSARVNDPRNDDPRCHERADPAQLTLV